MTESTLPPDEPDAVTDPTIDDVRASENPELGDETDPYELRSGLEADQSPTDDDPGSLLNR